MHTKAPYPQGAFNAHWFSLFNALSFQIVLGAPIILFAKGLGASSTVLGLIASFTPLMTAFQLPAAGHLERYGYKQFVLMGWGMRTVLIFVMTLIPLAGFADNTGKLALLIGILFFFNLMKGVASTAWLPWIAALIPEETRGRFLSLDQFFLQIGSLTSLIASAIVMSGRVQPWEYSLVFLLSAAAATTSLLFIKRIPDIPRSDATARSSQKVPWSAILGYQPFRRLLLFNLLFMAVTGSLGVFTIEYLRESAGMTVSHVLALSAFSFTGALVSLPVLRLVIDDLDSRRLFRIALSMFGGVIFTWFLIAAKVLPCKAWLVGMMNLTAGSAGALFNTANSRTIMSTMPEMGRNHFFALFTVITSLGLGAAPIVWGISLDTIGTYEAVTGIFHWHRHSFYFLALFFLDLLALQGIRLLRDARPAIPVSG